MVTIQNLQAGLVKFIDREIAPSLSGWDRVLVAGGGGLLSSRLPEVFSTYAEKPIISALGLFDPENGNIDIDAAYNAAKPYIGAEQLPVKIPLLNITIKIGKRELDTLIAYIKEGT